MDFTVNEMSGSDLAAEIETYLAVRQTMSQAALTPGLFHTDDGPVTGRQVADHIEASIKVLDRDGWTQMAWTAAGGSHCIAGALRVARREGTGTEGTHRAALRCMGLLLKARQPESNENCLLWNDTRGRTYAEVREALATTAEFARTYGPA